MNAKQTNRQNLEDGIREVRDETGASRLQVIEGMKSATAGILAKRPSFRMLNALEILEELRLDEVRKAAALAGAIA